jgi:hypothetical protein
MKKKEVVDLEVRFIRFVGAEVDERSQVAAGLFVLRRNCDGPTVCLITNSTRSPN